MCQLPRDSHKSLRQGNSRGLSLNTRKPAPRLVRRSLLNPINSRETLSSAASRLLRRSLPSKPHRPACNIFLSDLDAKRLQPSPPPPPTLSRVRSSSSLDMMYDMIVSTRRELYSPPGVQHTESTGLCEEKTPNCATLLSQNGPSRIYDIVAPLGVDSAHKPVDSVCCTQVRLWSTSCVETSISCIIYKDELLTLSHLRDMAILIFSIVFQILFGGVLWGGMRSMGEGKIVKEQI